MSKNDVALAYMDAAERLADFVEVNLLRIEQGESPDPRRLLLDLNNLAMGITLRGASVLSDIDIPEQFK